MMHPTPEAIRAARIAARLTQTQAAKLVGVKERCWQRWEADTSVKTHARMPASAYELFLVKTAPRAD